MGSPHLILPSLVFFPKQPSCLPGLRTAIGTVSRLNTCCDEAWMILVHSS